MKCDMKMMLKAGLGLAVLVAVAYVAWPGARELILSVSPFLFLLICPLMMLFMMKGMHSCHDEHGTKKGDSRLVPIPDVANTEGNPRPLDHEKAL